jgi:hypothetical protein
VERAELRETSHADRAQLAALAQVDKIALGGARPAPRCHGAGPGAEKASLDRRLDAIPLPAPRIDAGR